MPLSTSSTFQMLIILFFILLCDFAFTINSSEINLLTQETEVLAAVLLTFATDASHFPFHLKIKMEKHCKQTKVLYFPRKGRGLPFQSRKIENTEVMKQFFWDIYLYIILYIYNEFISIFKTK